MFKIETSKVKSVTLKACSLLISVITLVILTSFKTAKSDTNIESQDSKTHVSEMQSSEVMKNNAVTEKHETTTKVSKVKIAKKGRMGFA